MINGESYKVIVAEAAKNAMNDAGEIYERVFIVGPIMDGDKCRRVRFQHPRRTSSTSSRPRRLLPDGRRGARVPSPLHR
jgi:hypothetical protein